MAEGEFFFAAPSLDLLFSAGGGELVGVGFVVEELGLVLGHAMLQVGGDAGVELSAALADVDEPHEFTQ